MVQSDKNYKSRAVGITSEVCLTTDRRPFRAVSCFSFCFCICFPVLARHGVFHTSAIPEDMCYEPLYNTLASHKTILNQTKSYLFNMCCVLVSERL